MGERCLDSMVQGSFNSRYLFGLKEGQTKWHSSVQIILLFFILLCKFWTHIATATKRKTVYPCSQGVNLSDTVLSIQSKMRLKWQPFEWPRLYIPSVKQVASIVWLHVSCNSWIQRMANYWLSQLGIAKPLESLVQFHRIFSLGIFEAHDVCNMCTDI